MSARRLKAAVAGMLVIGLLAALVGAVAGTDRAEGAVAVRQPPQPKSGPGGSDYTHRGVRVSSGGSGADAWYVFEPTRPRPQQGAARGRHARLRRVRRLRLDVRR